MMKVRIGFVSEDTDYTVNYSELKKSIIRDYVWRQRDAPMRDAVLSEISWKI
jgi:hypothetical protein